MKTILVAATLAIVPTFAFAACPIPSSVGSWFLHETAKRQVFIDVSKAYTGKFPVAEVDNRSCKMTKTSMSQKQLYSKYPDLTTEILESNEVEG